MFAVPASAQGQPAPVEHRSLVFGLGLDPLGDAAASALWQLDLFGVDGPRYITERDALATAVATRIWIDPGMMRTAWAHADPAHQRALLGGLTQLGVAYRRNTSKPGEGFDCSGLTTFAWAHAGLVLTRQSGAQINQAAARTIDTAQAGDLVHYPGHVSMWLGVGKAILHAPQPGRFVEVKIQGGNRSLRFGDPTG